MKNIFAFVIAVFIPVFAFAQAAPPDPGTAPENPVLLSANGLDLNDFLWLNRPLLVFADSANDPRFKKQIELLQALPDDLADRDIVVITDTEPDPASAIRTKLRPHGFMLVLVTKDGTILFRKPAPWTIREISRSIDKLPARQQEIRDRRAAPG
jgi:hypothetical protein